MPMHVLGINCAYHESSVALVSEHGIAAAVEEERINRIKHAKPALVGNSDELPLGALEQCLRIGQLRLADIGYVAFSFNPPRRLAHNTGLDDPVIEGGWGSASGEQLFHDKLLGIPARLRALGFKGKFVHVDHAIAHAASAFYPSPFAHAAILSIDGIGEIESTTIAVGTVGGANGGIKILEQIGYPHSLGFLWEKVAMYFGMSEYDACKVMSLASFGDPARFQDALRRVVAVRADGFGLAPDFWRFRSDDFGPLEALFDLPALAAGAAITSGYMDVAAALQALTTEILLNLARRAHALTGARSLCLAGGVALNCVANTALFEQGPFEQIFVQPAANDAGTALGAALQVLHGVIGDDGGAAKAAARMEHAYLGPEYGVDEIRACLDECGLVYERPRDLADSVATLLAEGKVVGWFQGRMEFGPRALGNRSLLADPRDPGMVTRMNRLVKHREDHRPFCPSVREEDASDWFEIGRPALSAHFMLMAYPVHPARRAAIPAVVHVDGTSRIQLVGRAANPRYHDLLTRFKEKTGVPLLLNTSFNDREPIVCSPRDAIATFLRTGIDYLALGDFLLCKAQQPQSRQSRHHAADAA